MTVKDNTYDFCTFVRGCDKVTHTYANNLYNFDRAKTINAGVVAVINLRTKMWRGKMGMCTPIYSNLLIPV